MESTDSKGNGVLVALQEIHDAHGFIPESEIDAISDSLKIASSYIYGLISFYSFLTDKQLGRHVIRVCKSMPCEMKHTSTIIDSIKNEIGIEIGETTSDGRFTLLQTNCIGACDQSPAMMINSDVHGNLTPGKLSEILRNYL